jgi:NadR type nicotinamide-nucleotide adenylyltransferase
MTKKRGLTLGKYAPFHKGHQFVIETALAEVDELLVIIYDSPEVTPVPLNIRAGWIRSLYPQVKVIEAWDGPTEVGASPEIKRQHERYILNHLKIQGITHFYSSEFYGQHMSQALNAVNRIVDCDRKTVPISATEIRQNPFNYRHYLHPLVYRDLVANIVFLGAPSTGKTTMAAQLAREYGTVWMPEYGREYWEKHQTGRRLSLEQLVEIAQGHLDREEKLLYQANQYLFTDTNAITTYLFSLYYHGAAAPPLVDLANQAISRYDLVFLCDTDIPYADTWDRSGDANRQTFQKQTIADLAVRKIPYFLLQGDLPTRIQSVKHILSRYRKYHNLLNLFL